MGNKHGLPNSFQHPNFYIDQLDQYLTSEESRVLTKAIREILGWHNTIGSRTARIALSVFLEGKFDTKTGKQLCGGVNLSRKAIIAALDTLHKYKILQKVGPKTHPNGQAYKLNINTDCIDEDGLKQRRQRMKTRNTKQTRYARQTKQNHQAQVVEQHELTARVVEQPELKKARVVQQHEYSGCSTTRARQKARVVEQTEGNKIRRKKRKREKRRKIPPSLFFLNFFRTWNSTVSNRKQFNPQYRTYRNGKQPVRALRYRTIVPIKLKIFLITISIMQAAMVMVLVRLSR